MNLKNLLILNDVIQSDLHQCSNSLVVDISFVIILAFLAFYLIRMLRIASPVAE